MKHFIISISSLLFAALAVSSCSLADGKGRDITDPDNGLGGEKLLSNAVYLNVPGGNALQSILLDQEKGGFVSISPMLVSPAEEDTEVTISFAPDALEEFNRANGLKYRPVDASLVTFVEDKKNSVTLTIPRGKVTTTSSVSIAALDPEQYSFTTQYAVPLRITGVSNGMKVLSSPNYTVISLDRPFKTDVLHIKRMNSSMAISMNEPMKRDITEWTFQGQFHYSALQRNDPQVASPNQSVANISGGGQTMEWYTRIAYQAGIQIKRGRDGDDMWTQKPLEDHKWINLTFVFRQVSAIENTGRVEVYYGSELVKTFTEQNTPDYTWKAGAPGAAWNIGSGNYGDDYIRELKMWDRALTTAEIQAKQYLPEDPEAEGLLLYYPLTRDSYDEESKTFLDLTGNSKMTLPTVFDFEFVDNVVLPNETLVVE